MPPDHRQPRAFAALLRGAQARLGWVAAAEMLLASAAGVVVAALIVAGVLARFPMNTVLRTASWLGLGAGAVAAAAHVLFWRVRPLLRRVEVARAMERAAARRGLNLGDRVRSAAAFTARDAGHDLEASSALAPGEGALAQAHVAQTASLLESHGVLQSMWALGVERAMSTLVGTMVVFALAIGVHAAWPALMQRTWSKLNTSGALHMELDDALVAVPLVSGIRMQLVWPAYMARAPVELPPGDGEVRAPLGTRVTLSGVADRALTGASLHVGDAHTACTTTGRRVSCVFTVSAAASYRFSLETANGPVDDPVWHAISLEPDAVPTVQLIAPTTDLTLRLEEALELQFRADDDYGLRGFDAVFVPQSTGEPIVRPLVETKDGARRYSGIHAVPLDTLRVAPGDVLSVYVQARDTNSVAGPGVGRSETRVLTIFSAAAHHRVLIEQQSALLERLTDVLADVLEAPVGRDVLKMKPAAQKARLTAHEEAHAARAKLVADVAALGAAMRDDPMSPLANARALLNMAADLGARLEPIARGLEAALGQLTTTKTRLKKRTVWRLQARFAAFQARLETHILYLDDLLNSERLDEVTELAAALKDTQLKLKKMLADYKKAPTDEARAALLAAITKLKTRLSDVLARMAELQREASDGYLNEEAFKGDALLHDARSLEDMVEDGAIEDAEEALEAMLAQTEAMLGGMHDSKAGFGAAEYGETQKKLAALTKDLDKIAKKQAKLTARHEARVKRAQERRQREHGAALKILAKTLADKAKAAEAALSSVPDGVLYPHEVEDREVARGRTVQLERALRDGELDEARVLLKTPLWAVQTLERALGERGRSRFARRQAGLPSARDALGQARTLLEEIATALEENVPSLDDMLSGQDAAALEKDAKTQDALAQRAQKAGQAMREIAKDAPVFGDEQTETLQRAEQALRDAAASLKRGQAGPARLAQQAGGAALQSLRAQMAQMQRKKGMPMPLPGGGEGRGRRGQGRDGHGQDPERMAIPGASRREADAALRAEIIEAMREQAPAAYEADVKKYYEELVR